MPRRQERAGEELLRRLRAEPLSKSCVVEPRWSFLSRSTTQRGVGHSRPSKAALIVPASHPSNWLKSFNGKTVRVTRGTRDGSVEFARGTLRENNFYAKTFFPGRMRGIGTDLRSEDRALLGEGDTVRRSRPRHPTAAKQPPTAGLAAYRIPKSTTSIELSRSVLSHPLRPPIPAELRALLHHRSLVEHLAQFAVSGEQHYSLFADYLASTMAWDGDSLLRRLTRHTAQTYKRSLYLERLGVLLCRKLATTPRWRTEGLHLRKMTQLLLANLNSLLICLGQPARAPLSNSFDARIALSPSARNEKLWQIIALQTREDAALSLALEKLEAVFDISSLRELSAGLCEAFGAAPKPYTMLLVLEDTVVRCKEVDGICKFSFRPHLQEFLEHVSRAFSIVGVSTLEETLLQQIVEAIDQGQKYFAACHFVQNIEECIILKIDWPRCVVMSSDAHSFMRHGERAIYIQPFHEENDTALKDVISLLSKLVESETEDVKVFLADYRAKLLSFVAKGGLFPSEKVFVARRAYD